jgi:asparagine synthase (glutamine-hydrolysing)
VSDLLIALAVDFAGQSPLSAEKNRIAQAMTLGRAGDVRWADLDSAVLFARAEAPEPAPRLRQVHTSPAVDGGFTLFAGRLFGRDDLSRAIGEPRLERDDADLYAAAHMRFGDECDRRLVGNYAAIRWFPDRRVVRIARSATSDCPIHVWRDGSRLIVASIPRVLFAAGAPERVSDSDLADLLLLAGPRGSRSIYENCSRVPAASVAHFDRSDTRVRQFWSVSDVPAVRFRNDSDYVDAVDEQFQRSLKEHISAFSAPAVLLSGGLDSQAVAAYAVPCLAPGAKLRTYTSVPMEGWTPPPRPWKFGDESEHVKALAAQYPQIEPTFLSAADTRLGEHLDARTLLSSWPPFNETNSTWLDKCYAAAAADGCDAVFGADMGNLGFSYDGLTGFPDWFRRGRWLTLLRELSVNDDPRPFWRKLASLAVWPHVPGRVRRWRDRNNPFNASPFTTWSPLREDYARASGALDRARDGTPSFDGYEFSGSREWRATVWRSMMANSPEIGLGFQLLHGVAMPDPTSYVPLLELCAGIPDEQFLRNGANRWLARRLLQGKVPELVRTEKREGLQGADWPMRFVRERDGLLGEIERMEGDERLSSVFDFDRMKRNLTEWDGTDTLASRHFSRVNLCIGRGVPTARFVRYVEGRNVG